MKRAYLLDPIAVCTLVQFMKLLFRHEEIKYYQRYEEYNKCHKHLDSRMSALLLLWLLELPREFDFMGYAFVYLGLY